MKKSTKNENTAEINKLSQMLSVEYCEYRLKSLAEKIKSECEAAGYKLQQMIFSSYFDEESQEPVFVNTMIFKFQLQAK